MLLALGAGVLITSALSGGAAGGATTEDRGRTIVLGFDGMDPEIAERWMQEGLLPNFARLRERGHYQRLATTNPAQSPVAWSSFATGLNPGAHGIFDFLHRDPATYAPEYALSQVVPPEHALEAFGLKLPLGAAEIHNNRVGTPFWLRAEQHGTPSRVLRVPVTYPPDPVTRMLSGMGVPDLLGTQGTFTFYTTEPATDEDTGGRTMLVRARGGRVETRLAGPPHPLFADPEPLAVDLTVAATGPDAVRIHLGEEVLDLKEAQWSDWVGVEFRFGLLFGVRGLVRLHLVESFPDLKLYVSPIQFDPRDPAAPISSPPHYAGALAERIGLYHTLGMPEETWSLNEGRISDRAWLAMERRVLAEREAMFFDALDHADRGLVIAVFVQTDRVSHMFWRGFDRQHPLYSGASEVARGAIRWIYREADRILGKTLDAMRPNDRLIVLSDHGFASFREAVHLNRWLLEQGYLALEAGSDASPPLFANVDWSRTRAYALGLNGIFVNRRGREAHGIVSSEDVAALKGEIAGRLEAWRDPDTGQHPVRRVFDAADLYRGRHIDAAPDLVVGYAASYRASWQTALGAVPQPLIEANRQKWSGDHCIDPALVPGVLFTSFTLDRPVASIADLSGLVQASLQLDGRPQETDGSLGVLNVASPALTQVNQRVLGWMPELAQLAFWALVCAAALLGLYALTSREATRAALKLRVAETRKQLDGYDGPIRGVWRLLARLYRLRAAQIWFAVVPVVIGLVPILLITVWLSNQYGPARPAPGDMVRVRATPVPGRPLPPLSWRGAPAEAGKEPGSWLVGWPGADESATLIEADGTPLVHLPREQPIRALHQWRWWNHLIGNPAGYLPSPGYVNSVRFDLPMQDYLRAGPGWARGWLVPFLAMFLIFCALIKLAAMWRPRA